MDADREDAARLCQGDTSGLAGLMSRHQDRLFRYLLRLLGDTSVAEDVFQQTWLHVAERIRRYDASRPFGPWVVTVARNLALDMLRRQRSSSLDEIDEPLAPASGSDPLELAMARQSAARVEAALGALGPLDREVLTLRFEDELELPDLAAMLGVPLPTAKARLYRALERLRSRLPQPRPQPVLVARTREALAAERAERAFNRAVLAFVVGLAWTLAIFGWFVFDLVAGELALRLARPIGSAAGWYAAYLLAGWVAASAAAVMLGRRVQDEGRLV